MNAELMQMLNDAIMRGGPHRTSGPPAATDVPGRVLGAGKDAASLALWQAFAQAAPFYNGRPTGQPPIPGIEPLSVMPRPSDIAGPVPADPADVLARMSGAGKAAGSAASAAAAPDWAKQFNLVAQKPGTGPAGQLKQTFQVGDKPAYTASFDQPAGGPWQLMGMGNPDLEVRSKGGGAMNQGQANRATDAMLAGNSLLGAAGGPGDPMAALTSLRDRFTGLLAQPGEWGGPSLAQAKNAALPWAASELGRQSQMGLQNRKLDIDLMESMAKTQMMQKEFEDRYSPVSNLQKMIDAAEVQARGSGKTEAEVTSALAPMRERLAALQTQQSRGGAGPAMPAAGASQTGAPQPATGTLNMEDVRRMLGPQIFDLLKGAEQFKGDAVMPLGDFGKQVYQLSQQQPDYLSQPRTAALVQYMNDRYGPDAVNKYLSKPTIGEGMGAMIRAMMSKPGAFFTDWDALDNADPAWNGRRMIQEAAGRRGQMAGGTK